MKKPFRGSVEQRFWRHVQRAEADDCWPWQGFCDRDGYGKLCVKVDGHRANRAAHIVSWEIHNGPVPAGKSVLHRCNNEPCVNPKHLKLGDHLENMADRRAAGNYSTGEHHHQTKYGDEIVAEIRGSSEPARVFKARYGISESQVGNIRRGVHRRAA